MSLLTARRAALGAAAVGTIAALFLVLFAAFPQGDAPAPAVEHQPAEARLPAPAEQQPSSLPAAALVERTAEGAPPAPCDGCLNEPGALDVAETFLYHMRRDYIDVRAELYADIAARLEAAGLSPPHKTWLPKLPPGLADAPPNYSMSGKGLPIVERPGETWVVWVQEGWFLGESLESFIAAGSLPPGAVAWPPLKRETYLLVDARTGAIDATAMWRLGTPRMQDMHAYGDRARREASIRTEHWLSYDPGKGTGKGDAHQGR